MFHYLEDIASNISSSFYLFTKLYGLRMPIKYLVLFYFKQFINNLNFIIMIKYAINPVTGNPQGQTTSTLVSISEKVLTNVKGTNYRVATIDLVDDNGKTQRLSAFVYENNYKHGMKVGEKYLTTLEKGEQGILITVSHLQGGGIRATEDMFNFSVTEVTKEDLAVKP